MAALETTAPRGTASTGDARPRAGPWPIHPTVIAVIALTVIGAAVRVIVAHQSIFADELSTYWISATHGLGEVMRLLYSTGRIHHAEITPPLSFVTSWLTTRAGTSPELLRLPALLAGTATIPLVYAVGARTVGRRAALVATALTALSPFMIYYSAEARAYGLLMFFVLAATLSMLLAVDTGRRRYWVLYAVCSAAAFYTHYTCVFVLGAQLLWLLWTEPRLRRTALLANLGAALLVVPWIPGLIADEHSPTLTILSALSAFDAHAVRVDLEHWAVGYPYVSSPLLSSGDTGLRALPGVAALVLLALAAAVTAAGLAVRWRTGGLPTRLPRRVVLIAVLLLATPVGECVYSTFGNHIIGVRELAASWPFLALSGAAATALTGRRTALAASALAVAAFAIGALRMLEPRFARPNYQAAATYVSARASAQDVVIDETDAIGSTPGPLSGFDVAFRGDARVVRALGPAERDHPFTIFDPVTSLPAAQGEAVREAAGSPIFVVGAQLPPTAFPDGYRLVSVKHYAGFIPTVVGVFSRPATGRR